MYVIAGNISTRKPAIKRLFSQIKASGWDISGQPAHILSDMAGRCAAAGANAIEIDTQQHFDDPETLRFAVKILQRDIKLPLCLSTNNPEALEAGLHAAHRPVIVNFVSIDEEKLRDVLPMAVIHKAEIILLVSDPASPSDAPEMIEKSALLLGAANNLGIPNDRIMIDPGLIHITSDQGQRHLIEVRNFLQALPDAFKEPVRTTCWLSNASSGAPLHLRTAIENALLPMLAGLGLSSVFMDVLKAENVRTMRLVKVFNDELVYAQSEIE